MPWFGVVSVVDRGKERLAGGIWARSVWCGGGGILVWDRLLLGWEGVWSVGISKNVKDSVGEDGVVVVDMVVG